MRNKTYLILSFVWVIVALIIAANLYLLPYSKMDSIEPTYSPEMDQNNASNRIIFWSFLIAALIIEIILIKNYMRIKR